MKAIVKAKAEPGLWLEDVPVPTVGGDDVLIRVLKASICGTDVHIYNWDAWAQKTIPVPMIIGHEFVGVVDASGTTSKDLRAAISSLPKGTSPVGIVGIASPDGGIFVQTRRVSALIVPADGRSSWRFRRRTAGTPIHRSRWMYFPVSIR